MQHVKNRISVVIRVFAIVVLMIVTSGHYAYSLNMSSVLDDEYLYEKDDRTTIERLQDVNNMMKSPNETLPRGHWSYGAVKELAARGFLDDFDPSMFDDGTTLTRVEMAALVSRIFDNYLQWQKTGKISSYKKIYILNEPDPSFIDEEEFEEDLSAPVVAAPERESRPEVVEEDIPFFEAEAKDVMVDAPNGMSIVMTKKMPGSMMIEAVQGIKTIPEDSVPETKAVNEPRPKKEKISDSSRGPDWVERTVKVEEEVILEQKLMDRIDDLANTFKSELKDINKSISKDIKEVEKISNKNQKQIAKLQDEDERFKITGSDEFLYTIGGDYDPPDDGYYGESTKLSNVLTLSFTSKPNPSEDLTLSATTKAKTIMGTRTGYYGYIDGTNTAFNIYDLQLKYQDNGPSSSNFRLKTLALGNNAISYSPLTIFGNKVQGISMSLLLNDYGVNMFAGRTAYHYPIFLGSVPFLRPGDSTQYDRYLYGVNIQSPLFGEPSSMGNLQKIFMYDNKKTNFFGLVEDHPFECQPGFWVKLGFDNDPSLGAGVDSDESYRDLFCLPPEKNSVTSLFVRYPVIKSLNLTLTGEYAHSTYYKPGYGATYDTKYVMPETIDQYKDNYNIDLTEYGYEECDPDDPWDNVTNPGNSSGCWIKSIERRDQDDGFLLLFDFTSGPIQVFPIGYAKLGHEFVTKNMSLPGLDVSSLLGGGGDEDGGGGGGIGFLPISLQSLELFITNITLDMLNTNKYKLTSLYAWGGETEPMYLDPALVMAGMSSRKDKGGIVGLLGGFVDKLNTRKSTLKLGAWVNGAEYNISDNIKFKMGFTKVKVSLPLTCLDGNITTIENDLGYVVDSHAGDGKYECGSNADDSTVSLGLNMNMQNYSLFWKTSKNADFTTTYKSSDLGLDFYYSQEAVAKIVKDLVPVGRTFTLSHEMNYKLTSSTALNFSYTNSYDRVADDYLDGEANNKYPTVENHEFKLKVSTTF